MPLSGDQLAAIQAWSPSELSQALGAFATGHPPPNGLAPPVSFTGLFELRILQILMSRLPAQLAATPLIPSQYQSVLDGISTTWASSQVDGWATVYPPAVTNWFIGDLNDSLATSNMPAIVVSTSLPLGSDITQNNIGPTQDTNLTAYIYYVQKYMATAQKMTETARAADAIVDILSQYRSDPVTLWQNGVCQSLQRNVPRFGNDTPFVCGIVQFSVQQRKTTTFITNF